MTVEESKSQAEISDELGPLPAGRHGYTREQVAHSQRERLIAGLATAVAEHGYNATTIAHITTLASVSRRVFYENFESKEECFLATFDVVVAHARDVMATAAAVESEWARRVAAALRAMLAFLSAEPDLARLCLVEAVAAGPVVSKRFREVIFSFVPCLAAGRAEREGRRELPASTEDSLLGALVSMLGRSVGAGEAGRLEGLGPDLAEFLLAPYIGATAAEEVARRAGGDGA